jgi:hypothetical protein
MSAISPIGFNDKPKFIIVMAKKRETCYYNTNSGTPNDGRHLAPGRPTGPQNETLPSIVLMVLIV